MVFDWEPHKHVLRSLYLVQDMKLHDVMDHMEEHHGVKKSRRQYEGVFKRWGFRKHVKSDDWRIIRRKMDSRRKRGKSTSVYRDGRLVPENTLRKESRHDNRTLLDGYGPSASSPRTPPGFNICTPTASGPPFILMQNLPTVRFVRDLFSNASTRGDFGDFGSAPRVEEILERETDDDLDDHDQVVVPFIYCRSGHQDLLKLDLGTSTQLTSSLRAADCLAYASQFDDLNRIPEFMLETVFRMTNNLTYGMSDAARKFFRQNVKALLNSSLATTSPIGKSLAKFALEEAIMSNDLELAAMSLRAGRDPNMPIQGGICVPLQLAAKCGQTEIIQCLLDHGADPGSEYRGRRSDPPLVAAVRRLDLNVVQILLRHGADPNVHEWSLLLRSDRPALRIAVDQATQSTFDASPEVVKSLLEAGADVDEIYRGTTALHSASRNGHTGLVQLLLEYRANVNAGLHGYTLPVEEAAELGNDEITKLLIDHGAYLSVSRRLPEAAGRGMKQLMQALIESGADVNCACENTGLHTALHEAAKAGHISIVDWLIDLGADVDAVSGLRHRQTAVQVAAFEGHQEIVRLLIERGANVNSPPHGIKGYTALQAAVAKRQHSIMMLLLDHGASVNAPCGRFGTALHAVFSRRDPDIKLGALDLELAEFLIVERGAQVNAMTFAENETSVLELAVTRQDLAVVQMLLLHGADARSGKELRQAVSCWTPKSDLVDMEIIKLLLRAGAPIGVLCLSDILFPLNTGRGGPFFANMVQSLLDAGLDVNLRLHEDCGWLHDLTLLQSAIRNSHQPMIYLLLERGADINAPAVTPWGKTALQLAAEKLDLELVKDLLKRGAMINAEPALVNGMTALQVAARWQSIEMVTLLLERGADINARACFRFGRTALQAAAELVCCRKTSVDLNLIRLLLERGADVNAEPAHEMGVTALQAAAMSGRVETVILLLENGADVNAVGTKVDGRTALEAAAEHGRLDIAQVLLNVGAEVEGTRAIELATKEGHDGIVALLESRRDRTAV